MLAIVITVILCDIKETVPAACSPWNELVGVGIYLEQDFSVLCAIVMEVLMVIKVIVLFATKQGIAGGQWLTATILLGIIAACVYVTIGSVVRQQQTDQQEIKCTEAAAGS